MCVSVVKDRQTVKLYCSTVKIFVAQRSTNTSALVLLVLLLVIKTFTDERERERERDSATQYNKVSRSSPLVRPGCLVQGGTVNSTAHLTINGSCSDSFTIHIMNDF